MPAPGHGGRHDSFHLQSRGGRGDGRRIERRCRIRWTNFWRKRAASSASWVSPYLYRYDGPDAIRHLFRVASSLDSMVVGEPQILGQLKSAYALAKEHGAVSGFLDQVMTRAFNVAKRVRSETDIGPSAVSVSYAAVELAREIFGSLTGKTRADDGAGKMAESAARHLRRAGRLRHPGDQPHARSAPTRWPKSFSGRVVEYDDFDDTAAGGGYRDRLERRAALHPDATTRCSGVIDRAPQPADVPDRHRGAAQHRAQR